MTPDEISVLQAIEIGRPMPPHEAAVQRLRELGLVYGREPSQLMITINGRAVLDSHRPAE
jgi:hypothetical protein